MAIKQLVLASKFDAKALQKMSLKNVRGKGSKFTTSSSRTDTVNRIVEFFKAQNDFKAADLIAGDAHVVTRSSGTVVVSDESGVVTVTLE